MSADRLAEGTVVYFNGAEPSPDDVPEARIAAHNHVRYAGHDGWNGHRAWHQQPAHNLTPCNCEALSQLDVHYRIKRA
jgi:hypothetical protein